MFYSPGEFDEFYQSASQWSWFFIFYLVWFDSYKILFSVQLNLFLLFITFLLVLHVF